MILFTSSSNIISSFLNIIAGLLALKWLLPSELGYFNTFTIVTGYIVLAHIGTPVALSRDLPYLIGKGDKIRAFSLASVAKFWTILVSSIISILGVIGMFYFLFVKQDYELTAGLLVIIFQVWQGVYVTKYLKILYRTTKDFNKLAIITLIVALVSFASIYFIYKYGFYGLCIRAILIAILDFMLCWYWRPIRVSMKWDKLVFTDLLKTGFPIFVVNNIYGKWQLVQRTVVLLLLGTNALGLFTIVFVIGNAFTVFSASIHSVLYPTMMIEWGKGKSIAEIAKKNLIKPMSMVIFIFLVSVPILWYLLPISINSFLPEYVDIIETAQWMTITGFMGAFNILGIFYNVINIQQKRFLMYLSGILVWSLIIMRAYWFESITFELFPKALFMGYLTMMIITIVFLKNNWLKTQTS